MDPEHQSTAYAGQAAAPRIGLDDAVIAVVLGALCWVGAVVVGGRAGAILGWVGNAVLVAGAGFLVLAYWHWLRARRLDDGPRSATAERDVEAGS